MPSSLLDLDDTPIETSPTPPTPLAAVTPSTGPAARIHVAEPSPVRPQLPRMPASGRLLLAPTAPVVALTRLTSGIGTLSVQAATTSGAEAVVLGCAYTLSSGQSSFLNPDTGPRTGPPDARLPVLLAGRDRFPRLSVDLRQVRSLTRALFVLYSPTRTPVTWTGALIITTQAGSRIDVPLESASAAAALAAVSLHQVEGEIVVRAERDPAGSPREACANFGYDTIAWLDDATVIA